MQSIVECSGLNWDEAKNIVGNEDWRAEAEANRLEMMERGIWGVPSFRVGDTITWGQDRLWVIEHALQKQIKS
jgi:2-hydroxychromene-2-carboxylate isomerase